MNQIIEDFFAKENGNGESGEDLIKSGFVSIVGLPNAGKSTLLNALVGQTVVVVKKIGTLEKGEVKSSSGVVWSAKSQDGSNIEAGTLCRIAAVTGNTLEVKVKKDEEVVSAQQELP